MIVLDASVLIAFLNANDAHHRAAQRLLIDAVDDDLGANPLTLAEVLVAAVRAGDATPVVDALAALEVAELAFPADAAIRLARLRAQTGLKMPDCCVLLAAEDTGGRIATFDNRLAGAAAERNVPVIGAPRRPRGAGRSPRSAPGPAG